MTSVKADISIHSVKWDTSISGVGEMTVMEQIGLKMHRNPFNDGSGMSDSVINAVAPVRRNLQQRLWMRNGY